MEVGLLDWVVSTLTLQASSSALELEDEKIPHARELEESIL